MKLQSIKGLVLAQYKVIQSKHTIWYSKPWKIGSWSVTYRTFYLRG